MESFKVEHYQRENPGRAFPWFRSLTPDETQAIRQTLLRRLELPGETDALTLIKRLSAVGTACEANTTDCETLDFVALVERLRVSPEPLVYLNWHRYDDVDQMRFPDLAEHISDVWYPSSDDLDIFDASFDWILSVSHFGAITLARLKEENPIESP